LKVQATSVSSSHVPPPCRCPPDAEAGPSCSLTGAEQAARHRWLKQLRAHSVSVRREPDGATVLFDPSDELEAQLRALAAAEAQCCPFLSLEVRRGPNTIELLVTGPAPARPLIEAITSPSPGARTARRYAGPR
jgi:hypothetical protein